MRIWHLDCNVDGYENLTWLTDVGIDEIQSYDGRSKITDWKPLGVRRMYNREYSNTPGLSSHIPVFDKKAVDILKELINGYAEILPLKSSDGEFYAINVTEVLDCIDYKKSKFKTYRDSKRIMRFIKYEFNEQMVKGKHIFKIIDESLKKPFVSDEFRQNVIDCQLSGFVFKLVWNSAD